MNRLKKTLRLYFAATICSLLLISQSTLAMQQKEWYFNVYLDDTPIGYHQFILQQQQDQQQVFIKAEFDIKLMFFSIYTYLHENSETWQGQCLQKLSSSTNDNGEQQYVSIQKKNQQYVIETQEDSKTIDSCLRSFAYWNPQLLDSKQLLNSQTGDLIDIQLQHLGPASWTINNRSIDSQQYKLLGKDIEIDLWYSADNHWLGLESVTEYGNRLRYELQPGGAQ